MSDSRENKPNIHEFRTHSYEVNPLTGLKVDGEVYIEGKRPTLVSFENATLGVRYRNDSNLADLVEAAILDRENFIINVQPLSFHQQDASYKGTRTFKGVLRSDESKIIVFSGVGVVKPVGNEQEFVAVSPPHWYETVKDHMNMGHMQISDSGATWSRPNTSVFGAYEIDDMSTKLVNTGLYSNTINTGLNLEILLAGTHDRVVQGPQEKPQFGWMVYSLPSNALRTTELQALDLMQRANCQDTGVYGQFAHLLFTRMKQMHLANVVHLELHPGNCYPVLMPDGKIDLVITDWTTAQNILQLPSDSALEKEGYAKNKDSFGVVSSSVAAKATDIYIAFQNLQLLTNDRIQKKNVHKKAFNIDICKYTDITELQLIYFALATAGYLKLDNHSEIREVIKKVLYSSVIPDFLLYNPGLSSDFSTARGNINYMDRPNYLMPPAMSMLAKMLAKFLASDYTDVTYDLIVRK